MILSQIKKRHYLHLTGIAIVTLWLVMIGLLVKKVHFKDHPTVTGVASPTVKIDSFQREWKEIYLKGRKVGYAVHMIKPFEKGYFIQEEIYLRLNLMGMASGIYTVTQCQVDDQFLLRSFNFNMSSGVVKFNISGRIEGDHLILEKGGGKHAREQRLKISERPMIGIGVGPFFKSREITVGESFRLPLFDPSTMAQTEVVITAAARESLEINRMVYDTFRMETEMWGKPMRFWIDEKGTTLKEEGFMGLTIIRSSAANAPWNLNTGEEVDFYEITAVQADRQLVNPTNLRYLKLGMDGIDSKSLKSASLMSKRQRFHDGIMEITREKLPLKPPYLFPYSPPGEELKPYLEPEFNIESDEQDIIKKAQQIAKNDANPISVARKCLNWVYHNLEKRPVVSVPSALEVLKTRIGDCNEHATLLTAFLRALKIPARLSIGLVYTRGKFFYHAWTEAYIGEWISMDPTLNQMPADATHITLIEGNLAKQVEIARFIGTLKLKVLDYRYD
ncbi:MAG: transglutaminase-like domain-containing protein [Pseudomonadota bacterium]